MNWKSFSGLALASCLLASPGIAQKPAQPFKPGSSTVTTVPSPPSGGYQGGSDTCGSAMPIMGQATFPFDTTTATTGAEGQGETICFNAGQTGLDNDVWFCWTPTLTGNGVVETCNIAGVLDTKIAIYSGCACPGPQTAIACNDDACGLRSRVTFPVIAGNTYLIQLGSYPGATPGAGMMRTDVVFPPSNDDCANPDVLPGDGTYPLDLRLASTGTQGQNETLCYDFGTSGIASDVWYTYTAACNGTATLTTCGLTTVDTKLAVYPGAGCPANGTSIACNDDACSLQSSVSWSATAGATYTFQIGTFPGTGSNVTSGMFQVDLPGCPTGPGTPVCFGDGSGAPCGCGNEGPTGGGCLNSLGLGGVLTATGTADTTNDSVGLTATNVRTQPGLFFQGNNTIAGGAGAPFGDGLRCCGVNVVRLEILIPPAPEPSTANMTATITTKGPPGTVQPGDKKCYQYWYRDPGPANPCGSNFNLSNAVSITWF